MDKAMTASSQDWDAKAVEILPCTEGDYHGGYCSGSTHGGNCPANNRPAVAAALREAYQQGRRDQADEVIQAAALSKGE